MARTHKDVLGEFLQDPEFRRKYEALGPAFDLLDALLQLRTRAGLTQGQLAEQIGTSQTYIARIERKPANVTLKTLSRIAGATGADLVLRFELQGEAPSIEVRIPARAMLAKGILDRFE